MANPTSPEAHSQEAQGHSIPFAAVAPKWARLQPSCTLVSAESTQWLADSNVNGNEYERGSAYYYDVKILRGAATAREACALYACASYAGNRNCPCPAFPLRPLMREELLRIHTHFVRLCSDDRANDGTGRAQRKGKSGFLAATASHRKSLRSVKGIKQPSRSIL